MPEVTFKGPDGRLEGRYHPAKGTAPIALVLHPHPQHGGSMNNRVVYALYHAFVEHGFSVLRFNFRGVGRSQGVYDHGLGELADTAGALDWLQTFNPSAPRCWIAGFSFGAWIGMQLLMRRPEIDGFISVAPPANMYDFTFLAPCPASGMILHGADDQHVPDADVTKLANKLSSQKNIRIEHRIVPGADHFFTHHLDDMKAEVNSYLSAAFATRKAAAG